MSHTTSIKSTPIKSIEALRRAVAELRDNGVNVQLEQNTVPRMYYADQLAKHVKSKQDSGQAYGSKLRFHQNPEECDWVIRLQDSYYDIGLIQNEAGELVPFFDDYNHASPYVPATQSGKGPIRKFLGAEFTGNVEHWSGQREAGEQQLHSVGKLLQHYSKYAVIEEAENQGYVVSHTETDTKGNVHVHIQVN